jgi:hypothetical protein
MPANIPNDGRQSGDPCPECGSHLICRKNKVTQGYFLGCDQFPDCTWACNPNPKEVRAIKGRKRSFASRRAMLLEERWAIEDAKGRHALYVEFYGDPDEYVPEVYTLEDARNEGTWETDVSHDVD